MSNLCESCILYGRCSGYCGDTDASFYLFEEENDAYDYATQEVDSYEE